jgi:transcriptional regulator with XRE-family HTH domain
MVLLDNILGLIETRFESDAAFERTVGLKPRTVAEWKRGKSKSFYELLPKLSETFKISIDSMYGLDNSEKYKKIKAPAETGAHELILPVNAELTPELINFIKKLYEEQIKNG